MWSALQLESAFGTFPISDGVARSGRDAYAEALNVMTQRFLLNLCR